MVPPAGDCHLGDLLAESRRIGHELTRSYYREYADLRRDTFTGSLSVTVPARCGPDSRPVLEAFPNVPISSLRAAHRFEIIAPYAMR